MLEYRVRLKFNSRTETDYDNRDEAVYKGSSNVNV